MSFPINKATKAAAATLSLISYLDEDENPNQKPEMEKALNKIPPACNGPYALVWGPAINHGILTYIAQGADGSFAVAFRGTLTSFGDATGALRNLLDDVTGFIQVNWQYPLTRKAKISWGTSDALTFAISATDHTTGITMVDFFRRALRTSNKPVMVVGHSLGGALANVAAVWLMDQIPKDGGSIPTMVPFTFAAPTVTDQKFADLFAQVCPTAYHCVNKLDIVPMAWTNFTGIGGSFSGGKPTLRGFSPVLWNLVQVAGSFVKTLSDKYVDLPGIRDEFEPQPGGIPATNFAQEAGEQHSIQGAYLKYVDPDALLLSSSPVALVG